MAESEDKTILYDLPSNRHCACWSLNPWKARLALNYKGVDYETAWTEYPDVESTLASFGIPPAPSGPAPYTIPAIRLGGNYIMDSAAIAPALEAAFPNPPLHLSSPKIPQTQAILARIMEPLRGVWMPLLPAAVLTERSSEYFIRTRAQRFGMSLQEMAAKTGGESAWEAAKGAVAEMGMLLTEVEGPFVLGSEPSYADFVIVGYLHCMKRIDEKGVFTRLVGMEPALGKVYEACLPWLKRDDY